jgi:hypothetical protein
MLRKLGEHNILITLIGDKDVASRLDRGSSLQGSQRSNLTRGKDFVTERSALRARITNYAGTRGLFKPDQVISSLDNLYIGPDTELHRRTGLLATGLAVTPTGQGRVTGHFGFERAAHAAPSTSQFRHVASREKRSVVTRDKDDPVVVFTNTKHKFLCLFNKVFESVRVVRF